VGAISSVAFALAHVYQGWRGVLFTSLLGALFAVVAAASGLLAAIVLHALLDLRLLLVPRDVADAVESNVASILAGGATVGRRGVDRRGFDRDSVR
jgi:membrane protease YdiL (CAAX protease family)